MLGIAAFYHYQYWYIDVKDRMLIGYLKEQLYVMQPEGFVDPKGANKVCGAPAIHLCPGASISELEYMF